MRTGLKRAALVLASALILVVACAKDVESRGQPNVAGPEDVATNLDVPWGVAFLPDGSALIAERDSGAIKRMSAPGVVNQVGASPASHRAGKAVCSVSPRRIKRSSHTSRPRRTTAWSGCASTGAR